MGFFGELLGQKEEKGIKKAEKKIGPGRFAWKGD